ncbi:TonB-dependent receptor [Pontibacter sp. G13]|uniref:SusC/RagA family TonB-linked outer membrane protein n=1 Tax=Pontibacter sp. G13 TaxID=3074898 RepID=UPI00288A3F91|nr:TonB-dependent receptor [Pontibacter sp. G13]WNJ16842.1 TonB-dependent receptor [Pontibacter sp. G13]
MKKLLLLLAVTLCAAPWAMAQRSVSGTVTDKAGPLHYVAVVLKGTTIGVATDEQGKFSLEVPEEGGTLVFKYVGYQTVEMPLGASDVLEVVMKEDNFELDEVVVTGYIAQKRKDITGAVSSVSAEDLESQPVVNVQNALQGRAPGVTVIANSGTPGGGMNVRVRGTTSISGNNSPLFIVDGVPIVQGSFSQADLGGGEINALADIDPNDIASIEVLKDASSAAIYGARGANGVVLITTKKGKAGKTKVSLKSSFGIQEAWNTMDMLDSDEYHGYINTVLGDSNALGPSLGNTNWQDEIFRTGFISDNSVALSGGTEKTKYYLSVSHFLNEGIVKSTGQERLSTRLNLDHRVNDRLKIGANFNFINSKIQRQQNDNNIYGVVSTALLLPSNLPVQFEDGTYATAYGLENPVNAVENYSNYAYTNRIIANAFASWEIIDGLVLKATVGDDRANFREEIYEPSILQSAAGSQGSGFLGNRTTNLLLTEATLAYNKVFNDRTTLAAVLGTSYQKFDNNFSSITKTGYPTDDFTNIGSGSTVADASSGYSGWAIQSFFANANLNIADKYIITGVVRADGSSKFLGDNRYGVFPGVSGAWRISNEDFFNVSPNAISDLKFRVGYGATGNQDGISSFGARALYGSGANYEDTPGMAPTQLGNPDLKWETTYQSNAGVDFGLLNNRISASADVFVKNTTDLLLNRPLPTTSGFTSVIENIGEMRNVGWELNINTLNIDGEFKWTTNFNISQVKNEVVTLYNGQPLDVGFASRVQEGESIGSFFGYQVVGIFQTADEVANAPFQSNATAPGDIQFADLNGDGVINADDRTIIGNALPDFMGGLTNTLSYKGFDLSAFFQFSVGNDIYNNNRAFSEGMNSVFNQTTAVLDAWTPENTDTDMPRAVWGDPNNNRRDSDRFVEDGSYLRLKTASLGYTLPKSAVSKIGMDRIRIFVTGQNLLTFTNYSGFDPEVNTFDGSNTALGTDFLTYPQARSYTAGVNIDF